MTSTFYKYMLKHYKNDDRFKSLLLHMKRTKNYDIWEFRKFDFTENRGKINRDAEIAYKVYHKETGFWDC